MSIEEIKAAAWGLDTLAARVARDIRPGWYVNLGIGMPTAVADHVDPASEVIFHSENGILGVGPKPPPGEEDWDLVNAGKESVTLVPGAAIVSHCDSFALIRGGHLDLAIMGALQVSRSGDLANWTSGEDAIPAVGGAMDLAAGSRRVWVMMRLLGPDGRSKLVPDCSYPLTAAGVVSRIYTDVGIFETGPDGVLVEELPESLSIDELVDLTGMPMRMASDTKIGMSG